MNFWKTLEPGNVDAGGVENSPSELAQTYLGSSRPLRGVWKRAAAPCCPFSLRRGPFKVASAQVSVDDSVAGVAGVVDTEVAAEAKTSMKFLKTLKPGDPSSFV